MPRASRGFSSWAGSEVQRRGFSEQSATLVTETRERAAEEDDPLPLPAPGTGEMYHVVFQGRVPVREGPEQDAAVIDVLIPKMRVELFAWSGNFRQVVRGLANKKGAPALGWVLVSSESHGSLLETTTECHQSRCDTQDANSKLIERGWLSYKGRQELDLGEQPLAMAARKRNVNKVIDLLWRGYDPNAEDLLGETPLFEVVGTEAHNLLLVLLLAQADPTHQAKSGLTPMAMVEGSRHSAVLEYFAADRDHSVRLRLRSPDELEEVLQITTPDLAQAVRRRLRLKAAGATPSNLPAHPASASTAREQLTANAPLNAEGPQHFDLTDGEDWWERRAPLSRNRPSAPTVEQVCTRCGKAGSSDFRFCAFCGKDRLQPEEDGDASSSTREGSSRLWSEPSEPEGDLFRVVFQGRMPVRSKPSSDADVLNILKPGEEVFLISEESNDASEWRKIRTWCAERKYCIGWVRIFSPTHGMLLERVLPPLDILPSVEEGQPSEESHFAG